MGDPARLLAMSDDGTPCPADGQPVARSLVEVLRWRAQHQPDRRAFLFLENRHEVETELTYGELDRRARAIAERLQAQRLQGQRILLLYPPGLEYVAGLVGCLYAGAVAVPVYPPGPRRSRFNRSEERLQAIVVDCQPRAALITRRILDRVDSLCEHSAELRTLEWIASETIDEESGGWADPENEPQALAILQYTSGSTSTPKGVLVSHGNIMHNAEQQRHAGGTSPDSVAVSWLPFYHDMGLFGSLIHPMYVGFPAILMSPIAFLLRPFRWLHTMSRFGASWTGGPNFAYDLCVEKIGEEEKVQLDLSTWRHAFCGAEPVRAKTLERFADAFVSCGFRRGAFVPCYGLAEATLAVAAAPLDRGAEVGRFLAADLEQGRVSRCAGPMDRNGAPGREVVGCGHPLDPQQVIIVDPDTRLRSAADQVGEVWVSGPNVAQGYWGRPEESAGTFRARLAGEPHDGSFLRTGDLGFFSDGELFIAARLKELLIVRGRNHYPHDIEQTVQQVDPRLAANAGASFTVDLGEREELVIVQEVDRRVGSGGMALVEAIREAVLEGHGVRPHGVVLVEPNTVLKTSSGKIQRRALRQAYLENRLEAVVQWQEPRSSSAPAVPGPPPASSVASPKRPLHKVGEISSWLVQAIARQRSVAAEEIEVDAPFHRLGLDSAESVLLVGELEGWLGRDLDPVLLWDHPNIAALARHLASEPGESAALAVPIAANEEPIAIVGLGCRFPAAADPAAFWDLLATGGAAIREAPRDRGDPGSGLPGGFLDRVDEFEPEFFGISPREAVQIDPQQRLLLEVAWEAMEDAGFMRAGLAGRPVGVFVGISTNDYVHLLAAAGHRGDLYAGTGNALSIAANRISYVFDLTGPSMAIDTACSSSLVAVHMAAQSLIRGEAEMALAGGVNLILAPWVSEQLQQASFLAADGRCKTFDSQADGYVRSEGAGLVVLKPLSAARRDGDRIRAVLRGSAVNQDGRSNGLTAPSGLSQTAVVRQAWRRAGLDPASANYVEAHGTGTAIGDPIEVKALSRALGGQPGHCALGSVKTNVGHLESAAGIAGLSKVILALEHEKLPPSLHLETPNPGLRLEETPFYLVDRLLPWPRGESPRRAGVSSFGFGGANAHVVLEEAPPAAKAERGSDRGSHLLTLSARTETALRAMAGRLVDHLSEHPEPSASEICMSLNTGRSHLAQRLALTAADRDELVGGLARFVAGEEVPSLRQGRFRSAKHPRVAFLFTGQGSQYPGMGRELYTAWPAFRRSLDCCSEILAPLLDRPLLELLAGDGRDAERLAETRYTQPVLVALEYALSELWRSWGVVPEVVLGHSIGELAAALVAGVLDLPSALRLAVERGRLLQSIATPGAMAAVAAGPSEVQDALEPYREELAIAAVNAPQRTVVSGSQEALGAFVEDLKGRGVVARRLAVSHAFHSPLVESIAPAFAETAGEFSYSAPRTMYVSGTSGKLLAPGEVPDAGYWCNQLRHPVRFADGIATLAELESSVFVEIGPHPELIQMARRYGPKDALWLASLRRGPSSEHRLLEAVSAAYVRGVAVDWQAFHEDEPGPRIALPTYPFERRRSWFETAPESEPGSHPSAVLAPAIHPLLDRRLDLATEEQVFEKRIDLESQPWLAEHRVQGRVLLPAVAYLEMALAAGGTASGSLTTVQKLSLSAPLELLPERPRTVQLTLRAKREGAAFRILSRNGAGSETASWLEHARGRLGSEGTGPAIPIDLDALRSRCSESVDVGDLYAQYGSLGINYGPVFRPIRQLQVGPGEGLAILEAHAPGDGAAPPGRFHPALLDGALQALGAVLAQSLRSSSQDEVGRGLYLPVGVEEFSVLRGSGGSEIYVHLVDSGSESKRSRVLRGDATFLDQEGQVLAYLAGVSIVPIGGQQPTPAEAEDSLRHWFYASEWSVEPPPENRPLPVGTWLVLADSMGIAGPFCRRMEAAGCRTVQVRAGRRLERLSASRYTINPESSDDYHALTRRLATEVHDLVGVVHLWAATDAVPEEQDLEGLEAGLEEGVLSLFHLVRALAASQPLELWLATTDAQTVVPTPAGERPETGQRLTPEKLALIALGRVVPKELPRLSCHRLDLESVLGGEALAASIVAEMGVSSGGRGREVVYRGDRRFTSRWLPLDLGASTAPPVDPQGVYLVTGGQGGIGLEIARFLVAAGASKLVLVNRTALPPEAEWSQHIEGAGSVAERLRGVTELRQAGAEVWPVEVDVCDFEGMERLLSDVRERFGVLRGLVHAAGLLEDSTLVRMEVETLRRVLQPKVQGSWVLHRLTRDLELDFFVLFSSVAAIAGQPGQGNYVAANAFLDALAHYRRARGLPALTIDWGFWGESGMVATEQYRSALEALGVRSISNANGRSAFGRVLGQERAQVGIANLAPEKRPSREVASKTRSREPRATSAAPTRGLDAELAGAIRRAGRMEDLETALASNDQGRAVAARRAAAYAARALKRLGVPLEREASFELEEVAARSAVVPRYRALFERLVEYLVEDGCLSRRGDALQVVGAAPELDLTETGPAEGRAYLQLLDRCGEPLAEVLTGSRDARGLLFSGESLRDMEAIYRDSPISAYYNGLSKAAVGWIAEAGIADGNGPAREGLRILEVGAGTGGTTSHLLPILSGTRCEYVYTDVSEMFLAFGRRSFSQYPFVQYRLLDLELDLQAQGCEPASFDLVVAANVLHATRRLSDTCSHLRQLLRPGGFLVALELTRPHRLLDLTFGLLEGWWGFEDRELRPRDPLLAEPQWRRLLLEAGFESAVSFPDRGDVGERVGQHLLVARLAVSTQPEASVRPGAPAVSRVAAPAAPSAGDLSDQIADRLVLILAETLQLPREEIDRDVNFLDLGFDSLMAVQIQRELEDSTDLALDPTLLFEYSTVETLADYFAREHASAFERLLASEDLPAPSRAAVPTQPVAAAAETLSRAELGPAVSEPDVLAVPPAPQAGTPGGSAPSAGRALPRPGSAPTPSPVPLSTSPPLPGTGPLPTTGIVGSPALPLRSPAPLDGDRWQEDLSFVPPEKATSSPGAALEGGTSSTAESIHDVAVIGLGLRLPGATTPEALWSNLRQGRPFIREVPRERWDWTALGAEDPSHAARFGAFLEDVSRFDADFFGVAEEDANLIDPQQRLFLEVVWQTLERAGYRPEEIARSPVGVFVGVASHDYSLLVERSPRRLDRRGLPGNTPSMIANRVSYLLDFRGPSFVLDTACSSALVALHTAVRSLRHGDCELAIAGGVHLTLLPQGAILFEHDKRLAVDGQLQAFDQEAHGYVRGEAVGAVLLKPLSRALEDGDTIWAVIKGTAVGHDGHRKAGLTAPSVSSQEEVALAAYRDAGLSPETLGYLEAHGTGTVLGDGIEIRGLSRALSRHTARRSFCALGSVKTRFGHSEPASGITSLIATVLALRGAEIPPSLEIGEPNRHLHFEDTPFFLSETLRRWPEGQTPRRAAVNSYGYGGVGAHVVLEEGPWSAGREEPREPRAEILTLSARSATALSLLVSAYGQWLGGDDAPRLADLCATANRGRRAFEHRLAVVATSRRELARRLGHLSGSSATAMPEADLVFRGAGRNGDELSAPGLQELIETLQGLAPGKLAVLRRWCRGRWMERVILPLVPGTEDLPPGPEPSSSDQELLGLLARLYCLGVEVDWDAFYENRRLRRVPLPTYPFEGRRYWLELPAVPTVLPPVGSQVVGPRAPGVPALPALAAGSGERVDGLDGLEGLEGLEGLLLKVMRMAAGERLPAGETLDPETNFLDLGLDSIIATRLVFLAERAFKVRLSPLDLFEHPNLRALARFLEPRIEGSVDPEALHFAAPRRSRRPPQEPFPSTPLQHAYLSAQLLPGELGGRSCHVFLEIEVPASLDVGRLEGSFRALLERHSMLRAVFLPDGRQRIREMPSEYRIPVVDLRAVEPREQERRHRGLVEELAHQVFDPAAWPLFDVRAVVLEEPTFRLLLSFDVLLVDFQSAALLLREWGVMYADSQCSLPSLPLDFGDYVLAVEELRRTPRLAEDREYWRARIKDFPPPPALPLESGTARLVRPRFSTRSFQVPRAAWQSLRLAARAHGVSPSALVMAVFSRLLARWSGGDEAFSLNLPTFDRYPIHPDVDQVVGPFSGNLLLAVDPQSEDLWQLARRLHRDTLEALDHRLFTGVEVAREITLHRRSGLMPVAPVVFTSAIYGGEVEGWGRVVEARSQTPQVWLDCQVIDEEGGLRVRWDYVEALFDSGQIETQLSDFEAQLLASSGEGSRTSWAARPSQTVVEGPVEQPAAVSSELPELQHPQPLLHELVSRQAQRTPHLRAVTAGEQSLTYGELEEGSNRVAQALAGLGVGRGQLVALVMERGLEMIEGVVGILKTGAAFVPVDPAYPARRMELLLSDSGAQVALTQSPLVERVRSLVPGPVLTLPGDQVGQASSAPLGRRAGPQDLAYVVYTSGSSGRPKGVMIQHGAVVNTLTEMRRRFGLTHHDRVLGFSSISFDLSIYDVFATLGAGATLVTLPRPAVREPGRWRALIEEEGITVWNSVPTAMEMLLDYCEDRYPCSAPTLRLVLLSGDWIPVTLPDRVRSFFDGAQVVSLGGATEVSVWSVSYPIAEVDASWKSIPYGKALAGQSLHLLDPDLRPAVTGEVGEIYIGGRGLALGYWQDPGRTAEAFVPDPDSGAVLYRTGDYGRSMSDGNVEFLGRRDRQVKIRGFRVELGEIEAALASCPGVTAAVITLLGERNGERQLAAHYVTNGEVPGDLRRQLAEIVPDYMVPQHFLKHASLPLNSNGKVDRAALDEAARRAVVPR